MVDVYLSRFTPGLGPGDGEKISFKLGETVMVVAGKDTGRRFVIRSERMAHAACSGYVREGYFEDDPGMTQWAKAESALWPLDVIPWPEDDIKEDEDDD